MLKTRVLLPAAVCAAVLFNCAAHADVRLPALFSDHMVLQRYTRPAVWGWADPGEDVTVTIAGQSKAAKAGGDGRWTLKLDPLPGTGPYTLTVKGKNTVAVNDVLVGEVWLASGQSNMEMSMAATGGFQDEKAAAVHPQIRMFKVTRKPAREPKPDCEGAWVVCAPETVGGFSGAAYYFGRELNSKLGVPIGLVHSSHGGSPIEAWTSLEAQQGNGALKELLAEWDHQDQSYDPAAAEAKYQKALTAWRRAASTAKAQGKRPSAQPKEPVHSRDDYHHPTVLFNGMIAPLIPYTIRGAIWYQGESNGHTPEAARLYATQLRVLIADWRGRWGQGDFPFAWAQLPNFNEQSAHCWPLVRESMLRGLAVTNTGMTVNIDLGSTNTIHPLNKRDVGKRLALWARAQVYGEKVAWSGPLPAGQSFRDGVAEVRFQHAEGLAAREGALRGFELAGADGQWKPATARIVGDKVVVSSPEVKAPVAARYAWSANPDGNLVNGAGLPASPFRTGERE
jgi:hypothetical protein